MKKPLNIGVVMQSPDIGGAETYMYSLVQEFLKRGCSISLATNNKQFSDLFVQKNITKSGIPYLIDIIGDWKGLVKAILYLPLSVQFYCKLLAKYKREKVDVILMSNFGEKMLVTFLSQFFTIPVVWIEYGRLATVFKHNFYLPKVIYRLLKGIPKAVIVPSHNTRDSLITDARISLAKIKVIPCGTQTPNDTKKQAFDERFKGKFVIGNISRLTREKGQQIIIKAAPQIIKEVPNAFFILIGSGPDKAYFESLIKESNLEKYFLLPGFVEDRDEYLSQMDVFIFPTMWDMEGFGVVTIEAMMLGIPVIGSNYGPVPEIIDDQETGLLFPIGDSDKLAEAVIYLARDKKLLQKMGEKARKKAVNMYSIEKVSEEVLKVLYDATL